MGVMERKKFLEKKSLVLLAQREGNQSNISLLKTLRILKLIKNEVEEKMREESFTWVREKGISLKTLY